MRLSATAAAVALAVSVAICPAQPALAQQPAPAARRPTLTKPPRLAHFVEAPWPEGEKAEKATVLLQIAINAEGKVEHVAVQQSAGKAFDEAALKAARQFAFEPAELDGKPAPVRITYKYEFVLKEAPKKATADFSGVVADRKTGARLAGVTVRLDSGQSAVTDAAGKFKIQDVTAGKHQVMLSGAGFPIIGTEESFESGKLLDATYQVDRKAPQQKAADDDEDLELVVVAPRLDKKIVSTEVAADQSRRVPGAQGDVLKVVENLPGVGRAAVGSSQLVVWGAAPQDTRVYIDGVRVPMLYHEGGMRSVVHSDLVRSVELAPGGYGAAYGRGLGGLVLVRLRPVDEAGFHGSVAADFIDASASVRASLGDRAYVAIAARRSYLQPLLEQVTSRDVGEFVPIPSYYDSQMRVGYRLSRSELVEVGGMLSSDRIDRTLSSSDPAGTRRDRRDTGFDRLYGKYESTQPDGSLVRITPWFGRDRSRMVQRFGSTPAELDVHSVLYGLRATWDGRVASFLRVGAGIDAELNVSSLERSGSITAPAREGDRRVFGQPPSDQVNADTWKTTIAGAAPFGQADFAFLDDKLHVEPGMRVEPYIIRGSRITPQRGDTPAIGFARSKTALEPRLSVRYRLGELVTFKAAVGRYHQGPLAEDLSSVFGNPKLGISEATHVLGGAACKATDTFTVEVTGFHASSTALAVRNDSASPLLGEALVQNGRGRAYGAQFLLRRELARGFFGWASYSIIRSERTTASGQWRLFDYDQTHVITALASYDLGRGFEVGARFRYATGAPRTPVVGAYYDTRLDVYQPVFGARNSIRIPAFYQLDARVSKRTKLGRTELEVYLDVQNATNRHNAEELVYNYNYTRRGSITGLPILPVLGARFTW